MSELNLVLRNSRKEGESKKLRWHFRLQVSEICVRYWSFLFPKYLKIYISGCRDWKLGRVDKMRVALVLALCVAVASASPFFGNLFGSRGGSRARSGRSSHGHGGGWGMMMQQEKFFVQKFKLFNFPN